MYAAPPVYNNVVAAEPNISMYRMSPIYDDLASSGSSCDLDARQDTCLGDLEALQQRLNSLQAGCCGSTTAGTQAKLDIVIGCEVGSPAVYLAAVLATRANCSIKVFSHSSNTKEVDSTLTNKLLQVNQGQYSGVIVIYKDTPAPYFMAKPGRQVGVFGLSNILRYIARERQLCHLYNEADLQEAALVDENLALVDQLEGGPASQQGNLFNKISGFLKASPYLAGTSATIADIGLCCHLLSCEANAIPNVLKVHLAKCTENGEEMAALKLFM